MTSSFQQPYDRSLLSIETLCYNHQTEKLLSRTQLNGQASSSADASDSAQRGIPADIREDARVFVNPGESSSSMLARVARTNRALQDKVKVGIVN